MACPAGEEAGASQADLIGRNLLSEELSEKVREFQVPKRLAASFGGSGVVLDVLRFPKAEEPQHPVSALQPGQGLPEVHIMSPGAAAAAAAAGTLQDPSVFLA